MKNTNYDLNFSYIFIPFYFSNFEQFNASVSSDEHWIENDDKIKYLHKYVADRLMKEDGGEKNTYHYKFNREKSSELGVGLNNCIYSVHSKEGKYEFRISDIETFVFDNNVSILALQLKFLENDPLKISSAQYYLRKISDEKIEHTVESGEKIEETFVDIAQRLFKNQLEKFNVDFFFYATRGTERANFLTYIDVKKKKSYAKELFYLKWCYHDGFVYDPISDQDDCSYIASTNSAWGISHSAAVCLVNRAGRQKNFIETTFQKNFKANYLFTYALLLHQKYTMYLYLTKLSVDANPNLEELEKYKESLYQFENQYMFSYISEVPQYQRFYESNAKAFRLKEMFEDVKEPLSCLTEMQRQRAEEMQRADEKKLNDTLLTLSLLTIFSALADAAGFVDHLTFLKDISGWVKGGLVAIVLIISGLLLYRLNSIKKKR